ncbi:MAG: HD domain-containing phosphohydrolase [Bacillota bacterium]
MGELVKGVTLRRAAEFIEKAELRHFGWYLLGSWDGTEVIRQEVPAGKRFGLRPQEGWSALECFYLLKGEVLWEGGEPPLTLSPGDYLVASPAQEPCILRALTDASLLYVCSQPSFHMVSDQVAYLQRLSVSVETKDGYTEDHCRRIRDLSMRIGQRLKLDPVGQFHLFHGSYLHDLGKVAVPDGILQKPGGLTAEEWRIMREHPLTGGRMLAGTAVAGAAAILEQHHERLDGSGYPRGLTGDQICLEAQIVAVVDSFDAMTTDRVYRKAVPVEAALEELNREAGRLYNPAVVSLLGEILEEGVA